MRVDIFVECAVRIGSHSRLFVGVVPLDCGFLGDGGLGDAEKATKFYPQIPTKSGINRISLNTNTGGS